MNPFLLVLPILIIRYIILRIISKDSMNRADYYPPLIEKAEKIAFFIYQLTTIFLLIYLVFSNIYFNHYLNYIGIFLYLAGIVLYTKSVIDFAKPKDNGFSVNGLYSYSRNPMYVAFFIYFLGCCLLINSWIYFFVLIIFQLSVHYIILSEERWCIEVFGREYEHYMRNVRRYL
jgi:protein-S-isoprenylcysteine O-methyltransferase Ste14